MSWSLAPSKHEASPGTPNFLFAIPIAGYVDPDQWDHLSELLVRTVRSVLNQSNPNFQVLIAGHERPARLDEVLDPRVTFIRVSFKKPATPKQRRHDKSRKRWAIAAEYRKLGGGYFMYLDADDYVHRDLVDYVLGDDNRSGYFIPQGYALDYESGSIAPVPGVWSKPFNHVCGSSGVIYFRPDDLPRTPPSHRKVGWERFFRFKNHSYFQDVSLTDTPNQPVPFRGAIYTVNNALNLSNTLVRSTKRQEQLIEAIRSKNIADQSIIRRTFGLDVR